MQYNVAQLLKEGVGSTRSYGITESVSLNNGDLHVLPHGKISLMRTDKGVWVSARVMVGSWATCSRCLKRFYQPLEIAIEEEYLQTVNISSGKPLHVSEEAEASFTINAQHILDLDETLRQFAIVDQPMKPVCQESCYGLCPVCGIDRNENPCNCQERGAGPRWAALMVLSQDSDS